MQLNQGGGVGGLKAERTRFRILLTVIVFTTLSPCIAADPKATASKLRLYLPKILDDQRLIADSGFMFTSSNEGKDAGVLMNSRIRIKSYHANGGKDVSEITCNEVLNELKSPDGLSNEIASLPAKELIKFEGKIDFAKLDVAWMRELLDYGHWSLPKILPQKQSDCYVISSTEFNSSFWVKLRLLKGIRDKDTLQAMKEVRQLGRLLMTWDDLLGGVMAAGTFGIERSFYDALPESERPVGWMPIESNLQKRLKRYVMLYPLILKQAWAVPEDILEALYFNKNSKVGLCAVLSESVCTIAVPSCSVRATSKEFSKKLDLLRGFYKDNCNSWGVYQGRAAALRASWKSGEKVNEDNKKKGVACDEPGIYLPLVSYDPKTEKNWGFR